MVNFIQSVIDIAVHTFWKWVTVDKVETNNDSTWTLVK